MKSASLSEIRHELKMLPSQKVLELCLQLARFKKDNKELLHYALYESQNEEGYISAIQEEIDEDFQQLNRGSVYLAKKTIRKILRKIDKYIRYSGLLRTAVELNIHFLTSFTEAGLDIHRSKVLFNIYQRRLELIHKALDKLHPDIQFDYDSTVTKLERLLK